MKIVVTGSTGLIGTALVKSLARDGHTVCRLLRRETTTGKDKKGRGKAKPVADVPVAKVIDVNWDPEDPGASSLVDSQDKVDGTDAVVNLSGASIADGKWTTQRKMQLRSSRVRTTSALIAAIEKARLRPKVFVSASAIGIYGNRGDEVLTEDSGPGDDFLAGLSREWEAAACRAQDLGARVAITRFGIVLAKHGGALPEVMKPFRFGAGGRIGDGRQWMSWIALDDAVAVLRYALENDTATGAINVVAPKPIRNAEFTKELGRAMHRPAIFPAPAFALRLALGEMADALLLVSQRVVPRRLETLKYQLQYPDLPSALGHVLHED